jgi:hypothetical protein
MTTEAQKASIKQEKRTAKTYAGSRSVMSGAGWVRKADVRTADFMIENKTRIKPGAKSFTVKVNEIRELTRRAIMDDRIPVWQADVDGNRYVVLNEDDFLEMAGIE